MDQANSQPEIKRIFGNIFLIFAALTLPGVAWSLFGWLHLFLPTLVFLYLIRYGWHIGNRFVLAGTGLSLVVGLLTQTFDTLLFSLSLLPAGYVLARSGNRGDTPALSGLKGTATLAVCWALVIGAIGLAAGVSPYGSLIDSLNSGIDEAINHYRQNNSMAPDALMMLETTLLQMKVVLPIVLPAIFFSCALFLTWFTMVLGNRLAVRFCHRDVWPRYRYWRLPEKLIWLAIGAAILAIPALDAVRIFAVNLLILLSIIYCFQGFSVCVFFMNKWNVPLLFRSFIYVMIVFQSFGTLLLLIIGVADIWFDYRKLSAPDPESDKDTKNE